MVDLRSARSANLTHLCNMYSSPIKSFTDDTRKQTGEIRQTFLWERGRPLPDLSPYEQRLAEKLKPLIRRDDAAEAQP